jgi:acyl-CoA thioesterase YciA
MNDQNQPQCYPTDRQPAIRVVMMPRDTNPLGTIFGGVILSHIDIAAAIEAHRHHPGRVVTIAMDQVVFKQPVFVGDLVSFFTETRRIGTTSVTVKVLVWAQRFGSNQLSYVTEALVTLVAVDDQGRKVAIAKPSRSGFAE